MAQVLKVNENKTYTCLNTRLSDLIFKEELPLHSLFTEFSSRVVHQFPYIPYMKSLSYEHAAWGVVLLSYLFTRALAVSLSVSGLLLCFGYPSVQFEFLQFSLFCGKLCWRCVKLCIWIIVHSAASGSSKQQQQQQFNGNINIAELSVLHQEIPCESNWCLSWLEGE